MERTNGKEKGKGGKVSRKLAFVKKKKEEWKEASEIRRKFVFPSAS